MCHQASITSALSTKGPHIERPLAFGLEWTDIWTVDPVTLLPGGGGGEVPFLNKMMTSATLGTFTMVAPD